MLRSYVCMEFEGIHVDVKYFISKVFKSENKKCKYWKYIYIYVLKNIVWTYTCKLFNRSLFQHNSLTS